MMRMSKKIATNKIIIIKMESKDQQFNFLHKPPQTYGMKVEEQLEFDRIRFCETLGQKSIPYFGIYGKLLLRGEILTKDMVPIPIPGQ